MEITFDGAQDLIKWLIMFCINAEGFDRCDPHETA